MPSPSIDIAQVNLRSLPLSMQQLAKQIGLAEMLALVEKFPGIKIFIPKKASESHQLAQVIGFRSMQMLCARYGNDYLVVPKLDRILQQIRNQMVRELRAQNLSVRDIALALNYHERHVRRILQGDVRNNNFDMFADDF